MSKAREDIKLQNMISEHDPYMDDWFRVHSTRSTFIKNNSAMIDCAPRDLIKEVRNLLAKGYSKKSIAIIFGLNETYLSKLIMEDQKQIFKRLLEFV